MNARIDTRDGIEVESPEKLMLESLSCTEPDNCAVYIFYFKHAL